MAVCKITLGGLGWVLVYDNKTTKTWNRPFGGPASAHLRRLIEPHEKKQSSAEQLRSPCRFTVIYKIASFSL